MSGLPFAFAYAPILLALLALPLIWLLLRVTPPKPKTESFPPTRLLLEISRKEEQPARTPWWLILLRCLMAAALIVALAGPVYKPVTEQAQVPAPSCSSSTTAGPPPRIGKRRSRRRDG